MAAETEMTIILKARDETRRTFAGVQSAIGGIGLGLKQVLLAPLTLIGRAAESIYRRFFSLRALLVGGGFIAVFNRLLQSLAPNAQRYDAYFSPQQQKGLNDAASAWSKLGAIIQKVFGDILAQYGSDIAKFLDDISKWFFANKDTIAGFFVETAKGIKLAVEILKGAVELLAGLLIPDAKYNSIAKDYLRKQNPGKKWEFDRAARGQEEADALNAAGRRTQQQEQDWQNAIQIHQDLAKAIDTETESLNHYLVELKEISSILADDVTNALLGFIQGTQSAAAAFRSMIQSMLADLGRLFINRAFQSLFGSLLGVSGLGNLLGFAGNSNPGFGEVGHILPGRASGGPVSAGRPYMVGERGPELFIPGQSGSIQANGSGGNYAVHNHFHGPADPREVEKATGRALLSLIRSNTTVRHALRTA